MKRIKLAIKSIVAIMNTKQILFIISLFIGIVSYAQDNSKMETSLKLEGTGQNVSDSRGTKVKKSFKMDSLRLEMKVLHPDLWKKYRLGNFECNMSASFVIAGSLSAISGLVVNLTGNSDQKKIGKRLMITGGAMMVIGIPIFAIGLHTQQTAIKECEKRMQGRQAELQFGIMSSGRLGLALKF